MKSGLLWYDASNSKSLWTKIDEASERYYAKFRVRPNTCYVHPDSLPEGRAVHGQIRVIAAPTILSNHLWLGVTE